MKKKSYKNLVLRDFVYKPSGYFSYLGKRCEICLEPCLNGCDVGVYDYAGNLLESKYCTNLQGFGLFSQRSDADNILLRKAAMSKAQEYYLRYEVLDNHNTII